MAPDADDEDEPTGGPPPDPTLRAWRHPSEIASAEAAAARFRQQDARSRAAGPPVPLAFHRADRSDRAGGRSPFVYLALTAVAAAAAMVAVAMGTGLFYADVDGIGRGIDSAGGSTSLGGGGITAALPPVGEAAATTLVAMTDMGAGAYQLPGGGPHRLAGVTLVGDTLFTLSSVLGDRQQVSVEAEGVSAPADVVGRDDLTDVAVLRLTGDHAAEVQAAVARAQARTAIKGTVVQKGQISRNRAGDPIYGTLITGTSCPDAGGMALVDDDGRVIGLVVDTRSPVVVAVPIDDALAVARSVTAGTGSSEAWLGVNGKASPTGGVQITSVTGGSPADAIGLRVGDRLLEVNGTRVTDWRQLTWLVRQAGIGGRITLTLEHDGASRTTSVTIGTRPHG